MGLVTEDGFDGILHLKNHFKLNLEEFIGKLRDEEERTSSTISDASQNNECSDKVGTHRPKKKGMPKKT